ncbi:lactonase family protein [Arthrobacter sp. NPDC090010]|uniref:lactonase family protein n=1 Tax=Arthrobacter sp. NPDC090010 TaxID=3363942 RepID=UPI00381F1EFC
MNVQLHLGSYTEEGFGRGPGVLSTALDPEVPEMRATAVSRGVRNPSFLCRGPGGRLFAVEELDHGQVVELHPESLEVLARSSSGGSFPCHLSVLDGGLLLVANYGSGTVSALPLDGPWDEVPLWTVGGEGSGPVADRQEGPHAHSTLPLPDGRFLLADLGRDRVDEYRSGTDGAELVGGLDLPPGTGPRHLLLRGEELWIVGELDAALHRATRRGDGWELDGDAVPLAPGHEVAYPSELALAPGGEALVVGVRGSDTVAVVDLAVRPARLGAELACGAWPRHLAWSEAESGESLLCVAAERGHEISLYRWGRGDGLRPAGSVEAFSPTFVLPVG